MQKKVTGLLQKAGLQLPSVLFLTDGYIHSIRASDSSVKQFENVTKHLTIGSVDPENVARYQAKLREWEDKLSISEKMVDNAQKTGRLKIDIQLFARKSSDFSTVYLPKKEYAHVISEIRTWATESQLRKRVFTKPIGNYIYTVENLGDGDFRIIGKELIE